MEKRETAAKAEQTFSLEALRAYSSVALGVSSSTFDCVFAGESGEFTIAEAKKKIETYLKKEAK